MGQARLKLLLNRTDSSPLPTPLYLEIADPKKVDEHTLFADWQSWRFIVSPLQGGLVQLGVKQSQPKFMDAPML
ncbi:hypothetical protein AAU61_13245 [Desulfocarbo indianensis]|nr:hypothetical protein AAU61_13245 [Desulfocarbo indianensis]